MGAKKGYMAGGMAKKEPMGMKKGGGAKKPAKANPFEMMMKAKGRNMAKISAQGKKK